MGTLKVGMVGLDTSHCAAFTRLLHDETSPHHVSGVRVAGAFPGGSKDTAFSYERVEGITQTMQNELGVEIFGSIDELAAGMDAFFLESVDGRQHLEQFRVLVKYGKPVFIDKPLACSTDEAAEIAALATRTETPVMTASSIRFGQGISGLRAEGEKVWACEAFGPMQFPADYPPYFWYGIHSAEVLFSYMGKGCKAVRTLHREQSTLILGEWEDGRVGTVHGTRFEGGTFGATVFTDKGVKHGLVASDPPYYALMLKEVVPFFETGRSPIDLSESLEIVAFLDAATLSGERNGQAVSL